MFTVNHELSCKKGGFIAQRHESDIIRDLLTLHISKVCRDVETEPLRHPLDNEVFNLQSTVISREARLDMKAGGFWTPGVTAFFDVRVTHVTSLSNQGEHTAPIFKQQENEKKRKYNQRVTDVEMATFTPLVFGTDGAMHVQYSLSETTRIHDLSTRKMHLIRGNRRTAVLTNRTMCAIRESLLRPVSIRVLRFIVAVCRLFLSTRKRHLIK